MNAANDTNNAESKSLNKFEIQKLYIKELSCKIPGAPQIFKRTEKPEITTEIQIKNEKLEEGLYEVVLKIIVSAKLNNITAFIVEAHKAGIFKIENYDNAQIDYLLHGYCPGILYPYIRKVISDVVQDAGFAPLTLAPINFEMAYQQQSTKKEAEVSSTSIN